MGTHRDPVGRSGGWMSWRTIPTFAAGVLATLAAVLIVQCRGPGRADSAVTDRVARGVRQYGCAPRGRG